HQVSDIMQLPVEDPIPVGGPPTARAGAVWVIPALFQALRLGQIFSPLDQFRRVGQILAWPELARFGGRSFRHAGSLPNSRSARYSLQKRAFSLEKTLSCAPSSLSEK